MHTQALPYHYVINLGWCSPSTIWEQIQNLLFLVYFIWTFPFSEVTFHGFKKFRSFCVFEEYIFRGIYFSRNIFFEEYIFLILPKKGEFRRNLALGLCCGALRCIQDPRKHLRRRDLQYCCKALHPLCLRGSSLRLFFLAHVVGIFFTVA